MVVQNAQLVHEYQTIEECEAVLERMASIMAPANSDMMDLAATLAAMGEDAPDGQSSIEAERWRAEAQLRQAEARYRALVEQIPAVSFMAPLDGSVSELYVSPQIESLLGFSAAEWLSNPILWYSQLHPDDQERWQEAFARTINAGEHFKSDYRFIARDGRIVWVHGEARVVTDDEGRPMFLQGVAFDITESKTSEEKLRLVNAHLAKARDQALEASRAKSAFLANMSHELRTPLNAIVGFTEMLQEDAQDGGNHQFLPDLQQIHSSARHLLGMIGGILDLSKIEAGKMDLFLEPFGVADLIRDVVQSALPMVEENGNCLEVECADDIGEIVADLTKVRQVLYNLLSNAAKFSTNGTITLKAERLPGAAGEQMRIEVLDTGIGMTPEQMSGLFQSFSQADVSTTRKYGGTGLGLAISQRFSRMMGGDIRVSSELGKGSKFTLGMPCEVTPLQEDVPFDVGTDSPVPARSESHRNAILVIDDDAQVRDLMTRFLTKEGWQVVTASSAVEGLMLARELSPAAITLDATIANTDGWSLLTAIKTDSALCHIPVILITLAADVEHGYTLGVADYLTKPIDWGRLSAMLGKYRGTKAQCRVLVIDDEPANREILGRMAAREGWEVTEAANGRAALKQVIDAPPDLIFLDLMMPEMDGFEVVRLLRKTQAGRSIPVVVVTAKDLTAEDRKTLSGSVEKIMQKGAFRKEELLQEVKALVSAALPNGRSTQPAAVPGDMQGELHRARAERDAVQSQARSNTSNWEKEKAEMVARQETLAAGAADAQRQLREQQQSIEFLQAECDEAGENANELERLRAEVARLKAEGISQRKITNTPQEPAIDQLAEATALKEKLTRKLDALRNQNEELKEELASLKKESVAAPRPPRKKKKGKLVAAHSTADAPRSNRVETDTPRPTRHPSDAWHVVYKDEDGHSHRMTCSTPGVRMWFEKGLLHSPMQTLASRTESGPFNPLSSFPEFRDLFLTPSKAQLLEQFNETDRSSSSLAARPAQAKQRIAADRAPSRDSFSWATLIIPLMVGIITALIGIRFLMTR